MTLVLLSNESGAREDGFGTVLVILSGGDASRSEASAESKDPSSRNPFDVFSACRSKPRLNSLDPKVSFGYRGPSTSSCHSQHEWQDYAQDDTTFLGGRGR